jgi:Arc/MetJ-type ribon-helix-helix transcriptional regulator
MDVSIPDSLTGFITSRVRSGRYPNADAFIADLVRREAAVMEGVGRGEPLAIDGHFDRRLEALLDEASASGDYVAITSGDFDEMEREALVKLPGSRSKREEPS